MLTERQVTGHRWRCKLKNRRVEILRYDDDGSWGMHFRRLRLKPDEPKVVVTKLSLSDDAMKAVIGGYIQGIAYREGIDALDEIASWVIGESKRLRLKEQEKITPPVEKEG